MHNINEEILVKKNIENERQNLIELEYKKIKNKHNKILLDLNDQLDDIKTKMIEEKNNAIST